MENLPKVSVICLCYNHAAFVSEAIHSVQAQTYPNVELIVVDDASTDRSVEIIESTLKSSRSEVSTLFNKENLGNCTSFNLGLALADGDYIIDLAADDVLLPDRISIGVSELEQAGESTGVHYCEVIPINSTGEVLKVQKVKKPENLSGDLYLTLINHYWINAASMMMRRSVLKELNGYDESLSYEDFDFWIRSARNHKYLYSEKQLVKKRILKKSLGDQQSKFRNKHELSTFQVCVKIKNLNKSTFENQALKKRILYEISRCIRLGHFGLSKEYWKLYQSID